MVRKLSSMRLENYKPLRELVFQALKEAIIGGELKPGERLMEVQLAEEMGVSRTPVREAIRKLELEGLVVMIPRKGAYVSDITIKDAAEFFEIRWALEGLAAALAAERITDEEIEELERVSQEVKKAAEKTDIEALIEKDAEFHKILFNATRNDRLAQMIKNLKEQLHRFREKSFANPKRVRNTIKEHQKIIDALKSRDAQKAEILTKEHIKKTEYNVMSVLRKQRDFGKE